MELQDLLPTPHFKENIRVYNSILAFTSIGAKIDQSVMNGYGPFTFRIHGQNHHRIGPLLPKEGQAPKFNQLYIYDTANEIQNRISTMSRKKESEKLDAKIVGDLISMLDANNQLTKEFRKARDKYEAGEIEELSIRLIGQKEKGRQYDLPTGDEIAGLIVGNFESSTGHRDVLVQSKTDGLQRINTLHQHYMALQYPLLFPYGESGFHLNIPYKPTNGPKIKRENVTIREYYSYQIQSRLSEGKTLILGGRLLHQFIVDAYTAVEEEQLRFNRNNQKKLRADLYNNVRDAVGRGDTDSKTLGKRIILPASFTGGPRYMLENYHDAMAIFRTYGNPHLFITITANPAWPEIEEHLQQCGNGSCNDRPDVASRVFKMKLNEMMSDFKKGLFFGDFRAGVYTIEFQKRGLPHAHILLWLQNSIQNPSPDVIDKIISAELPDKERDAEGYELVKKHMMHGPCGLDRPQSPCMENGICSKKYPRPYAQNTSCDKNGYIVYRRQEDPLNTVQKSDTTLDNRYVIPHNLDLMKKYRAHINVEWCCTSKAIKYLFKYITKGVDKATIIIEKKGAPQQEGNTTEKEVEVDEIKNYQECRYLSAHEASWRIFGFEIHEQRPAVQKLIIHLEGQQNVVFDESDSPENIEARMAGRGTMFTEWMEANKHYKEAQDITYVQFPIMFVWNTSNKIWTLRERGTTIGKIVNIHPSAGDLYYLRLILNHVKGKTSFADICTVGDKTYSTFMEACNAMGLLDGDKECHEAIDEASGWAKKEIQQYTLVELQRLLIQSNKSLDDFPDMPKPEKNIMSELSNSLLDEERKYNIKEELVTHSTLLDSLNSDQQAIYTAVMDSIDNSRGKLFFLYGPGGTGKTHVYRTIIAKLRSTEQIVLPVVSSGIAATLLPGGRTAHSRFKIPIDLHEESMCDIKPRTMLAELIERTKLIIWDEAPMAHRHTFEAVD
ncbi:uncharacterized protein LOC112081527 [Eutrema salsugineum]|uniref:uncharacterized protein LOC112081527 n=1 Tax=Eutrema salsugineum TaxID=72664 RepID=UPI000CED2DE0|nr:uncharacterized protein LOC112081527 [Eutrema salsugineum]